ncbi:MAG TPA: TetR/AcrR family transcriptional regulator [Polyangiaceae bacterium]|nr:TetR/AcrR family transcriptional regulator [Polyangiaceae bacterium]
MSAALELLQAQGYEALTIDGVAARAHASKATIYRRWLNKAELVKAALDTLDAEHNAALPDTGALRTDLLAVLRALRDKASQPYVNMMSELVSAARRDQALATALQAHVEDDELSPFQAVLRRAVRRRLLPRATDTTLVHDVAEALILRQLQRGLPFDAAFCRRVVDRVLLPLLAQPRSKR